MKRPALALLVSLAACSASAPAPESAPAPAPFGEFLLYDFTAEQALLFSTPTQIEFDALLKRFPHPHAVPGATCDPNFPGTPPHQRAGGILLPRITKQKGSFTKVSTSQTAYLIDYCLTGVGQPRTRRLLVLDQENVEIDIEFADTDPAEEVLLAKDLDGDSLAEVLLIANPFINGRTHAVAAAYRLQKNKAERLGKWTAIIHCVPGQSGAKAHRLFARNNKGKLSFRDEEHNKDCFYPPSPPHR